MAAASSTPRSSVPGPRRRSAVGEKRTNIVKIKLSDRELAELTEKAEYRGIARSAYAAWAVMAVVRGQKGVSEQLRTGLQSLIKIAEQACRATGTFTDLAHYGHSTPEPAERAKFLAAANEAQRTMQKADDAAGKISRILRKSRDTPERNTVPPMRTKEWERLLGDLAEQLRHGPLRGRHYDHARILAALDKAHDALQDANPDGVPAPPEEVWGC